MMGKQHLYFHLFCLLFPGMPEVWLISVTADKGRCRSDDEDNFLYDQWPSYYETFKKQIRKLMLHCRKRQSYFSLLHTLKKCSGTNAVNDAENALGFYTSSHSAERRRNALLPFCQSIRNKMLSASKRLCCILTNTTQHMRKDHYFSFWLV